MLNSKQNGNTSIQCIQISRTQPKIDRELRQNFEHQLNILNAPKIAQMILPNEKKKLLNVNQIIDYTPNGRFFIHVNEIESG